MQVADVVVVVKCNRTMSVCPSVDSENSITYAEIFLKSMHKQRLSPSCGGNERHFQFNPIQVRACACVCV